MSQKFISLKGRSSSIEHAISEGEQSERSATTHNVHDEINARRENIAKSFTNTDEAIDKDDIVVKGTEGDIEKSKGEGTKGGKVIGHTKSGKPIYGQANHPSHKKFTSQDHNDAADIHIDNSRKPGHHGPHQRAQANAHLAEAERKEGDKNSPDYKDVRRDLKKGEDDNIEKGEHSQHKYIKKVAGHYVYHESYQKGKGAKAHHHEMMQAHHEQKAHEYSNKYSSAISRLSNAELSSADVMDNLKDEAQRAIHHATQSGKHKLERLKLRNEMSTEENDDYKQIYKEHIDAGVMPNKYAEEYEKHQSIKEKQDKSNNNKKGKKKIKKADESDIENGNPPLDSEERYNVQLEDGIEKAQGEGSKGGKVIGHTKSGKSIYGEAHHEGHKEFTADEHKEAAAMHKEKAEFHSKRAKVAAKVPSKMSGDVVSDHLEKEKHHEKQAQRHEAFATAKGVEEDNKKPYQERFKKYKQKHQDDENYNDEDASVYAEKNEGSEQKKIPYATMKKIQEESKKKSDKKYGVSKKDIKKGNDSQDILKSEVANRLTNAGRNITESPDILSVKEFNDLYGNGYEIYGVDGLIKWQGEIRKAIDSSPTDMESILSNAQTEMGSLKKVLVGDLSKSVPVYVRVNHRMIEEKKIGMRLACLEDITKGYATSMIGDNPTFNVSKTGKEIKSALTVLKTREEEKKVVAQAGMTIALTQCGGAQPEENTNYDINIACPKRFSYNQRYPNNEGEQKDGNSSPLRQVMDKYNDACWNWCDATGEIFRLNNMIKNIEDNKSYKLTINQVSILGL